MGQAPAKNELGGGWHVVIPWRINSAISVRILGKIGGHSPFIGRGGALPPNAAAKNQ